MTDTPRSVSEPSDPHQAPDLTPAAPRPENPSPEPSGGTLAPVSFAAARREAWLKEQHG